MKHIHISASILKNTKDAYEHKARQMRLQIRLQVTEQRMLPLTHSHWST